MAKTPYTVVLCKEQTKTEVKHENKQVETDMEN